MSDPVHDYLAEIGRNGGAAGRGPANARERCGGGNRRGGGGNALIAARRRIGTAAAINTQGRRKSEIEVAGTD
jgi:hypothetical protein